jgi:hypothetical protein
VGEALYLPEGVAGGWPLEVFSWAEEDGGTQW